VQKVLAAYFGEPEEVEKRLEATAGAHVARAPGVADVRH
jgi:hypothetical protein